MKRYLSFILIFFVAIVSTAQGYYTIDYGDKSLTKNAKKWIKKGEWRNGFMSAKPDKSVNITEFYKQYQKNDSHI